MSQLDVKIVKRWSIWTTENEFFVACPSVEAKRSSPLISAPSKQEGCSHVVVVPSSFPKNAIYLTPGGGGALTGELQNL